MATYSSFPVTVDGVRLDSSAWNITAKSRSLAGVRNGDSVLPGVDGVAQSLNDDFEPATMTLSMWVVGTDANGVVPPTSNGMAQCRANLDELAFLFGKRHGLLNVTEVVNAQGATRRFFGKVVDAITPEIRAGGRATFTVSLQIGDAMWEDETASDWSATGIASGVSTEVTTMLGATGPISDGIFVVTGPAANPQINDLTTSAYVRLNRTLAAGEAWRVNAATWSTRYGTGLTLGSNDTAGAAADAITVFGGGNARMLRMVPQNAAGGRRVYLSLGGTGFSAATALAVRARRKYLI